jgi:hypothetical protein
MTQPDGVAPALEQAAEALVALACRSLDTGGRRPSSSFEQGYS